MKPFKQFLFEDSSKFFGEPLVVPHVIMYDEQRKKPEERIARAYSETPVHDYSPLHTEYLELLKQNYRDTKGNRRDKLTDAEYDTLYGLNQGLLRSEVIQRIQSRYPTYVNSNDSFRSILSRARNKMVRYQQGKRQVLVFGKKTYGI